MRRSSAIIVAALLAASSVALGGATAHAFREALMERVDTLRPYRVTSPPVIDGNFDEPFWKLAQSVSNFKTFIPDFDITPKEQTEVALAYDSANLYFAFRCYDDPSKIKASISARDQKLKDDFICINLDAFDDQQGLTAFYVNPHGIQGDSRFTAGSSIAGLSDNSAGMPVTGSKTTVLNTLVCRYWSMGLASETRVAS